MLEFSDILVEYGLARDKKVMEMKMKILFRNLVVQSRVKLENGMRKTSVKTNSRKQDEM